MLEKPGWPLPRGGHFVGYAVGQILSWDTRTMIWAAEEHRLLAVLQRIVRDHALIGLLNRSSVTQFAQEVAVLLLLELGTSAAPFPGPPPPPPPSHSLLT